MIVVADAGPIHYLVLIEAADVMRPLYRRVIVPETIAVELCDEKTPPLVRTWITTPRHWCEIQRDPRPDPTLAFLGAGEQAAILLALSLHADRVLMDDQAGRREAERRDLSVTGTLGVLAEAHRAQLLDFETALDRLRATSFYVSDDLVARVRERLSKRTRET